MSVIPDVSEEFERRFPEVAAAFRKVEEEQKRAMFLSPTSAKEQREEIYYSVRGLEAARKSMIAALLNKHIDQIRDEHAATLANNGKATA